MNTGTTLYELEQFEPLTDEPWVPARVEDAIAAIVADAEAAFDPTALWPADEWTPNHQLRYEHRFYVESPSGTPGLVPWPGSMVIWPWERAWSQDMNRTEVQSMLKEDEKKGGKKR